MPPEQKNEDKGAKKLSAPKSSFGSNRSSPQPRSNKTTPQMEMLNVPEVVETSSSKSSQNKRKLQAMPPASPKRSSLRSHESPQPVPPIQGHQAPAERKSDSRRNSPLPGLFAAFKRSSVRSNEPDPVSSLPQISTPRVETPPPTTGAPVARRSSPQPGSTTPASQKSVGSQEKSPQLRTPKPLSSSTPKPGYSSKPTSKPTEPTTPKTTTLPKAVSPIAPSKAKPDNQPKPAPVASIKPNERTKPPGRPQPSAAQRLGPPVSKQPGTVSRNPKVPPSNNARPGGSPIRKSSPKNKLNAETGNDKNPPESSPGDRTSQTGSQKLPDSVSTRTSPKMYTGESSPSMHSEQNSLLDNANDLAAEGILFGTDPQAVSPKDATPTKSLDIKCNADEEPEVYMSQPFLLSVAGICDANNKNYYPLQEKIAYLESKLIDMAVEYHNLQEEHRLMKLSHRSLDESLRNAELVARDQVVFENLKLNYQLVSSELDEAKRLIKELRNFGWDNLPQRLLLECRKAHDQVDRITKERNSALHEHSAARNIANQALKQVKVLQRALEDHRKISDQLMDRETQLKDTYNQALKQLNQEWEEKLLTRHNRDKRRQQHLAFLLEESKQESQDPQVLEDIAFRANMVFRYPALIESVEEATHVRGMDLGVRSDPATDKNWQVASKVSKATSEHLIAQSVRTDSNKQPFDSEIRLNSMYRNTAKHSDLIQLKNAWGEQPTGNNESSLTDAERQAWHQFKTQLMQKYEEKMEENRRLKTKVRDLEDELREAKHKNMTERQMENRIKELDEENQILVEHYLSEMVLRKKYLNMVEDLRGKIRVYCRVRAAVSQDKEKNPIAVFTPDEYTVLVKVPRGLKVFHFNRVFGPEATQEDIFGDIEHSVRSVIDGYNVSILAYGECKSGKKHTMTGDRERIGLIPRIFNQIFAILEDPLFRSKFHSDVSMTMFDLRHNGQFVDLLAEHSECQDLEIQTDIRGNMQVQGIVKRAASCAAEMNELYARAFATRRTLELKITTNRSNLIIGIYVVATNKLTKTTNFGKFTIVTLGNSERTQKSITSAEPNKEIQDNSDSLSALGDVITSLALGQADVPYKCSKLTALLQDSLGGNSKTIMIVHVDPTEAHVPETLNSLNYASRMRTVTNQAEIVNNSEQVAKLRAITERLKYGEPVPC